MASSAANGTHLPSVANVTGPSLAAAMEAKNTHAGGLEVVHSFDSATVKDCLDTNESKIRVDLSNDTELKFK